MEFTLLFKMLMIIHTLGNGQIDILNTAKQIEAMAFTATMIVSIVFLQKKSEKRKGLYLLTILFLCFNPLLFIFSSNDNIGA